MATHKETIQRIESLIQDSGRKRRGERSGRDRAAANLLKDFREMIKGLTFTIPDAASCLKVLLNRETKFINTPRAPGPGFDHIHCSWRGDNSWDNFVVPALLSLAEEIKKRDDLIFYPIHLNEHILSEGICVNVLKVAGITTYSVLVKL